MCSYTILYCIIETFFQKLLLFSPLFLYFKDDFFIFYYIYSFYTVFRMQYVRFVCFTLHIIQKCQVFLYLLNLHHLFLVWLLLDEKITAHWFVLGAAPEIGLLKDILQLLFLMQLLHFLLKVLYLGWIVPWA